MRDFRNHPGKQIVRQYRDKGNTRALAFLAQEAANIREQQYKAWEDGYAARDAFKPDFLRQKAEYIHGNSRKPH